MPSLKNTILGQFILKPRTTGAICPSSIGLARELAKHVNMDKAEVIAELGPGTGAVTRHILEIHPKNATFFAVELNNEVIKPLRKKFPELTVFEDSASNLRYIMESLGFSSIDVIISGLPWAAFPDTLQDEILDAILDVLAPGGKFTTFAYLQGMLLPAGQKFRKRLARHFSKVEKSPVIWNNIPPAFVYRCTK